MTIYLVTEIATGAKVYSYQADAPIEWNGMEFATHNHTALPDEAEIVVPTNPEDWHITKLAFRERFTQAEKIAIEIASLDDPSAPMQQRALAAGLRSAQADQRDAAFIDLKNPSTVAGVQQLEAFGLIAAGRANEILNTLPTAEERFYG
jgi:hypothetical protein